MSTNRHATRMGLADIDAAHQQLAHSMSTLAGIAVGMMLTAARLQGVPEEQRAAVVEQQLIEALREDAVRPAVVERHHARTVSRAV